jgi:hypothetical protein
MTTQIINTRADLDSVAGTQAHEDFMVLLKGTMTRKQDTQVYPEGYSAPGYEGEVLEPIWADIEDLSTIERFGFKVSDFA